MVEWFTNASEDIKDSILFDIGIDFMIEVIHIHTFVKSYVVFKTRGVD